MPFRHATKPALRIPVDELEALVASLIGAGYDEHDGHKVRHRHEVATFRRRFVSENQRRQCHVQVVCVHEGASNAPKHLDVYAHTEPDMESWQDVFRHGMSALLDKANFAAGSRMLRKDLKALLSKASKASKASKVAVAKKSNEH